ncbi:hypothetical protein PAPHI01_1456 [Pancytospora philotis]|nr:hypothetical protein PAPHI01_1456 [Pancytospora philotis]
MSTDGAPRELLTYNAFYDTPSAKAFCSLTVTDAAGAAAGVTIHSPDSVVRPSLYPLKAPTYCCSVEVVGLEGCGLVDYVNAVAMCMLQWNATKNVLVAAANEAGYIVYCPEDDTVHESFFRDFSSYDALPALKAECVKVLGEIQAAVNMQMAQRCS